MKYELRKLCARDIAPITRIITGIGWAEFKGCFGAESIRKIMNSVNGDENALESVGVSVAMDVFGIILNSYPKCENALFGFLADIAGVTPDEIGELSLAEFAELFAEIVKKEEFADFFGAVSGFLK